MLQNPHPISRSPAILNVVNREGTSRTLTKESPGAVENPIKSLRVVPALIKFRRNFKKTPHPTSDNGSKHGGRISARGKFKYEGNGGLNNQNGVLWNSRSEPDFATPAIESGSSKFPKKGGTSRRTTTKLLTKAHVITFSLSKNSLGRSVHFLLSTSKLKQQCKLLKFHFPRSHHLIRYSAFHTYNRMCSRCRYIFPSQSGDNSVRRRANKRQGIFENFSRRCWLLINESRWDGKNVVRANYRCDQEAAGNIENKRDERPERPFARAGGTGENR